MDIGKLAFLMPARREAMLAIALLQPPIVGGTQAGLWHPNVVMEWRKPQETDQNHYREKLFEVLLLKYSKVLPIGHMVSPAKEHTEGAAQYCSMNTKQNLPPILPQDTLDPASEMKKKKRVTGRGE